MIKSLKNYLYQNIPEMCPLSEAILWVAHGHRPLSFEDIKKSHHYPFSAQLLGLSNQVHNSNNEVVEMSHIKVEQAKRQVIHCILKGQIEAYGTLHKTTKIKIALPKEKSELGFPTSQAEILEKWCQLLEILNNQNIKKAVPIKIPTLLINQNFESWKYNNLTSPHDFNPMINFSDIHVNIMELLTLFIDKGHLSKEHVKMLKLTPTSLKHKAGRPPRVTKADWLEEMIIMFLSGELNLNDTQDSAAIALSASLQKRRSKIISPDTITRNWIRNIFQESNSRKKQLTENKNGSVI